jgi:site-specific DNA-methyltransferase (adenine-specific)
MPKKTAAKNYALTSVPEGWCLVPIGDLRLDPKNMRDHGPEGSINREEMLYSLRKFGQRRAATIRKETMTVSTGNLMVELMRDVLEIKQVVCYISDDDELLAQEWALTDNRMGEYGRWKAGVESMISDMAKRGSDIADHGFDEDFVARMAKTLTPVPPVQPAPPPGGDIVPADIPAITTAGELVELGPHTLHCADCVEVLRDLDENSIDACVTDPPYGIGFMGQGWDSALPGPPFAAELFRVLKPGAHGLLFAANRTIHRLAVMLEDAGFEVRDQIGWLTYQGFPKSHDVSKAIDKKAGAKRRVIGTKRSGIANPNEPARHTIGASSSIDVDITAPATPAAKQWEGWGTAVKPAIEPAILVRKPLDGTVAENVLKWGTGGLNIDACRYPYGDPSWPGPQDGDQPPPPMTVSPRRRRPRKVGRMYQGLEFVCTPSPLGRWPANVFYCPKTAASEREGNTHATVKPVRLMRWLLKLVTPPGGTVLEPFLGSGSTLIAAHDLDLKMIGIEQEPKYCDIIRARWSAVEG